MSVGLLDDVTTSAPGEEEDAESEVKQVLSSCIHSVAMRSFWDDNHELIEQLEILQHKEWIRDEVRPACSRTTMPLPTRADQYSCDPVFQLRYAQRMNKALGASRAGRRAPAKSDVGLGDSPLATGQTGNASSSAGGAAGGGSGSGGSSCSGGVTSGATVSAKSGRRGKPGQRDDEAASDRLHSISQLSRRVAERLPDASLGDAASLGAKASLGSGVPRRAKCKSATPVQGMVQGGQPGPAWSSHADSLLPSTPARSQFVFEVEKPLNLHAPMDEARMLQRRLSMLSALQAETVKQERKARLDARAGSSLPSCALKPPPAHWGDVATPANRAEPQPGGGFSKSAHGSGSTGPSWLGALKVVAPQSHLPSSTAPLR